MRKRWLLSGFWVTQNAAFQINGAIMGSDRHEFMTEPLEMGGKLPKLAGEILMNQKDPHKSKP